MQTTPEQKAEAKLHATAWEDAWDELRRAADRTTRPEDQKQLATAAALAMYVGGGYRKIANGQDLDD